MMTGKFHINNNYILFAGTLCLLLASYQLAFKNTIQTWQLNRKLEMQINGATLSEQPAYLEREDKILGAVINAYQIDTVIYRNSLITLISEIGAKEHVRIIELPAQGNLSTAQYTVQKIDLKGDFFALLKTLNHLQQLNKAGYVRSILLKKNVNAGHSKEDDEVVMEVFVEAIK